MNSESNSNKESWGYLASKARTDYLPRIFKTLPDSLREAITPVIKKTSAAYDDGNNILIESIEYLWLFSEIEVTGSNRYSKAGEGEQYEHFLEPKNHYFGDYFWARSPIRGNFCLFNGNGVTYASGGNYYSFFFGFCI